MIIAAIETRYAGCHFRSRLEARWAVFFDHLNIRWEYEPQGFELRNGRYLPDFLLTLDRRIWFEIKPESDTRDDPRWADLVIGSQQELVVARGMPRPDADVVWGGPGTDGWMQSFMPTLDRDGRQVLGWDNGRAFCVCPSCGQIGLEFEGRSERMRCHGDSGTGTYTFDHQRLLKAYTAARSARFEHGQSG